MTLEDSGEEVSSLEDAGAVDCALEAGMLEAGAEQADRVRAKTVARRVQENFMKITSIGKRKYLNKQEAEVNAFLSKVGCSPHILPILRNFWAEGKTQETFVDLREHLGGVLLSIVYYNWMMISSAFQEGLWADGRLQIAQSRSRFYNNGNCRE